MIYTAAYRNSAIVVPALLLLLVMYFSLLAWAISSVATEDILSVVAGGTGLTVVAMIALGMTAQRVHRWEIEAAGLRIEERPRFAFAGLSKCTFVPWIDINALRQIESGFERQIEIQRRGGALHRMSQQLHEDANGRRSIPDNAGLDAFTVAISARLAAAGAPLAQAQQALSFWNRLPGLAIICVLFVVSVALAGSGLVALSSGTNFYGAVLKGAAIVLLLPVGAGYLLIKSVKRRMRVLERR